jgi:hypothetical protein
MTVALQFCPEGDEWLNISAAANDLNNDIEADTTVACFGIFWGAAWMLLM